MTADDLIAEIRKLPRSSIAGLLVAIGGILAESDSVPAAAGQEPDELLDVEHAARLLGKSKSWLYHNHRDLPFTILGIGKAPRFSRKGLERYIAGFQKEGGKRSE